MTLRLKELRQALKGSFCTHAVCSLTKIYLGIPSSLDFVRFIPGLQTEKQHGAITQIATMTQHSFAALSRMGAYHASWREVYNPGLLTLIRSQHSLTSTLAVAFIKESCYQELVSTT